MNLNRLTSLRQLRNILPSRIQCQTSGGPLQLRSYARKSNINPDDAPIRFTTSGAVHGIADIRRVTIDDTPWYQGIAVIGSFSIFLIYFCILREENDVDIELNRSLYDRIEGLEEVNLQTARRYFLEQGNSTEVAKIDERMKNLGIKPH